MKVNGVHYRTIWVADDGWSVEVIDQTRLPHEFVVRRLTTIEDAAGAVRSMIVRGAPLIGATAAYGLCLQARQDASLTALEAARQLLMEARPTAVNLQWAVDTVYAAIRRSEGVDDPVRVAYRVAAAICDDDVASCTAIGRHGLALIRAIHEGKHPGSPVHVLTHCNAGWLATVDRGTALAPVYEAHDAGLAVHVWVSETRPRNQGASLTAWELDTHGVPYTVIVDNASGHIMQRGDVDLCITGSDRTTMAGDVCNKIGTYMKALAARDNRVPFYVALPHSTIDWTMMDSSAIPIEERAPSEVTHISGRAADGSAVEVRLTPLRAEAGNYAFDVTPSHLVSGLITDRGICPASRDGLLSLFPERAP
jgi:methylthioribose-1-phosphate isomerase